MDESVSDTESMNKRFISKISVNAEQLEELTLVEHLAGLNSDELVEDDYGNLRYIGADPNNYVYFNCSNPEDVTTCEKWRIIGLMKEIENEDGSKESKVKLIRAESIGEFMWDNRINSESGIYQGSNNWNDSATQKRLNDTYYNRIDTFDNTGLTEEARNMISTSVWNLGGSDSGEKSTKEFYQSERGSEVNSGRAITWLGKVGLIYPSDYGYATSGGSTTNRATCLNTTFNAWDQSNVSDCRTNNWLRLNDSYWTIMPVLASEKVYTVGTGGPVTGQNANISYFNLFPVLYLKTNLIVDNETNGSNSNPFILKVV